jgi:hypothetical protein
VASAVAANPVGAAGESVNLSNERVIYCPRYLQDNFANLMRMASDVDQVYYALLDLKNNGTRPPVLVLNSLIIAAGAHNRLDRAFAMIQEFEPVSSWLPACLPTTMACIFVWFARNSNFRIVSSLYLLLLAIRLTYFSPSLSIHIIHIILFLQVFNTYPNALTYAALMGSVAQSRSPKVDVMLTILQVGESLLTSLNFSLHFT